MSAGAEVVNRDLSLLAPKFRAAIEVALVECSAAGFDAFVFEGYRTQALQAIYYARGRTVKPPEKPVTNAPTNLLSWHGYGLAVDVISKAHFWDVPRDWYPSVAAIFKQHGCAWGGEWKSPDYPHFQWGRCKPSPSTVARDLIRAEGMQAVWRVVEAV